MRRVLVLLFFSVCSFAQDNTNPYCGPGNVPAMAQDGVAAPIQRCMFTQISSTPSSNYPKFVGPTDSLPMALSAAVPGDMIVVDPTNVTPVTGKLALPSGTAQQWITIKTASPLIPDEYTKVNPSFAAQLPKIVLQVQNSSIVGGQYVRLIGFEVTRPAGTGIVYNLFSGLGHDVILDRVYAHGTPGDETNRGVMLSNSYNVAIINSWFADFHCMAVAGTCSDSQAIGGGSSTVPDGNYKIVNNHLESSGQEILFGGGAASVVPTDIVITYNEGLKPSLWNPSDPSYVPAIGHDGRPHPWIVKNHIELKNASRVLIEGNRLQNVWGGFSQVGTTFLLTAKNQAGGAGSNICPICAVSDVIIRYNDASYMAQALQIACSASDNKGWPAECARYSAHDNLFDHMQYVGCYECGSFLNAMGSGYNPLAPPPAVLHDVTVDHNTFINGGWITPSTSYNASGANGFLVVSAIPVGNPTATLQNTGLNWTNNIFDTGCCGAYNAGGGTSNCWATPGQNPKTRFAICWPNGSFTGNQFSGLSKYIGSLPWPDGNGVNPSAGANQSLIDAAMAKRR
jgi:hypothetical protein